MINIISLARLELYNQLSFRENWYLYLAYMFQMAVDSKMPFCGIYEIHLSREDSYWADKWGFRNIRYLSYNLPHL